MGQSQFMPSSFLTYGADGDGDGKVDIWNNIDAWDNFKFMFVIFD